MIDSSTILKKIKKIVQEKEPSAKIYLYGSRARGTAYSDSEFCIFRHGNSQDTQRINSMTLDVPKESLWEKRSVG